MSANQPARILLVRLSHLGDVVHALPVFHALRERWPQARLGWIVQPEFAALLEGLPGLDEVLRFRRRGGLAGWREARRSLVAFAADLAVDAQGNLKSAMLTRLSGAPRRLGLARECWQEPLGARFMTELAPCPYGRHAIHKASALIDGIGSPSPLSFGLGLSPEELAAGKQRLLESLGPSAGPRWILHLGREGDARTWPAERFGELARLLSQRGERVLILSGPSESEVGRRLTQELAQADGVTHWVGQADLRGLAALCTEAAGEGVGFVGCDSGPSHLAAACGMAVSFLSGPQDPDLTGPWPLVGSPGSAHRILRADPNRLTAITDLGAAQVADALRT